MTLMPDPERYPASLRALHWMRAILVLGLLWAGWYMTGLPEDVSAAYDFYYPWHKTFGLLALPIVLLQMLIRVRTPQLPEPPAALPRHERVLSTFVHRATYVLLVLVPLLGYAMSSSFTESDGVLFFGLHVPELLPKNDDAFRIFQWLHKVLAYSLLGLIVLHVAGALKHRFLDADRRADVLPRMW